MADIEAGKVAHVIVKDMCRAGRDYLQTGFYTEVMFRQHGIHFVAIANSVDSNDQNSNEFAPFLNIMNEWYLRDLSRKQKTAIRVKGESGKPTTNCAIYGYKKDPDEQIPLADRRGSCRRGAAHLPSDHRGQRPLRHCQHPF